MTEDVGTTERIRLTTRQKLHVWEREKGRCYLCGIRLSAGAFIFEHVLALELGGTNDLENISLTCLPCAREKTKVDHSTSAKAKRQKAAALGLKVSRTPLPFGRNSPFKRKMNGKIERRKP